MKFANVDDYMQAGRGNIQDTQLNDENPVMQDPRYQMQRMQPNPRNGKFFFILLRFVYKTFRIFHVSFFFYFGPFLMMFYQFYLTRKQETPAAE